MPRRLLYYQIESILWSCNSCQRYMEAAKLTAKTTGKQINFKFIAHPEAQQVLDIPKVQN